MELWKLYGDKFPNIILYRITYGHPAYRFLGNETTAALLNQRQFKFALGSLEFKSWGTLVK